MAWSGGTFTRSNGATGWQDDAAASIGITASRHDTLDNDLATGINTCLTKDGQNTPTADLPMGGFKHTNVANATARTEYARVSQIQDNAYLYAGTSTGTANAQVIAPSPAYSSVVVGSRFTFKAGATNTGATTLNVGSSGAFSLLKFIGGSTTALLAGDLVINRIYEVVALTTTSWLLLNPSDSVIAITPTVSASAAGGTVSLTTNDGTTYQVQGNVLSYTCNIVTNWTVTGPEININLGLSAPYANARVAGVSGVIITGATTAVGIAGYISTNNSQLLVSRYDRTNLSGSTRYTISGSYFLV